MREDFKKKFINFDLYVRDFEYFFCECDMGQEDFNPSLLQNMSHFQNSTELGFFLPPSLLNGQMFPSGKFFFFGRLP